MWTTEWRKNFARLDTGAPDISLDVGLDSRATDGALMSGSQNLDSRMKGNFQRSNIQKYKEKSINAFLQPTNLILFDGVQISDESVMPRNKLLLAPWQSYFLELLQKLPVCDRSNALGAVASDAIIKPANAEPGDAKGEFSVILDEASTLRVDCCCCWGLWPPNKAPSFAKQLFRLELLIVGPKRAVVVLLALAALIDEVGLFKGSLFEILGGCWAAASMQRLL
uniref:Uncharacterized protein n=1 Tax=Romanomermis culicivorax TaxID=13658 RepID=A0A915HFN3_ROMCU